MLKEYHKCDAIYRHILPKEACYRGFEPTVRNVSMEDVTITSDKLFFFCHFSKILMLMYLLFTYLIITL